MSLFTRHAATGVFAVALASSACQTASVVPGVTPGTSAADSTPDVSIKQPAIQAAGPGSSAVTISWTFSNIAAPHWKLLLNIGNGGFTDQTGNLQCGQSPCTASLMLGPGNYEVLIEEQATGVGDKIAFTVH